MLAVCIERDDAVEIALARPLECRLQRRALAAIHIVSEHRRSGARGDVACSIDRPVIDDDYCLHLFERAAHYRLEQSCGVECGNDCGHAPRHTAFLDSTMLTIPPPAEIELTSR